VAFAMVACKNGSTDPGGGTPPAPTVTTINVSADALYIEKGEDAVQFSAVVVGTNSPSQAVTWSIVAEDPIDPADSISIDEDGVLEALATNTSVASGDEITIKATSVLDPTKSGQKTIIVYEQGQVPEVSNVEVVEGDVDVEQGRYFDFTASVTGTGVLPQDVTWSVAAAQGSTLTTGTRINDAGRLFVALTQAVDSELIVTATSDFDSDYSGTATVTVIASSYVPVDPTGFVERVALENGAYVIYKFELPPGRTFGDYLGLSFDVKLENPENAVAIGVLGHQEIHSIRLLGIYRDADFIDEDPTNNEALGVKVTRHIANEQYPWSAGNKLNGYIAGQRARSQHDYAAIAFESAFNANGYNTIGYDLSGMDGTGANATNNQPVFPALKETHWAEADDPGPFYFAIGISGEGAGGLIVQSLKNIKLVANPNYLDETDDVYSISSGFQVPAYSAYVLATANDGSIKGSKTGNAWRDMGVSSAPVPLYIWYDQNYEGGPAASKQWVFSGSTYVASGLVLPNPKRDGYILDGWFEEATTPTTQFNTGTSIVANKVLYAKWSVDENWGGAPEKEDLKKIVLPAVPTWINDTPNTFGWATKGADENNGTIAPDNELLELSTLKKAVYLELKTSTIPTGGGTVVWGNEMADGGWRQTGNWGGIFDGSGNVQPNVGVTIEGDAAPYTITFELSKAFVDFEDWLASEEWIRFGITCNWGDEPRTHATLGIIEAVIYADILEEVDLGAAPTWINSNNQWGWATKGADPNDGWFEIDGDEVDEDELPDLEDFLGAKYLVLETTKIPTGGGTLVWGNDANGWRQTGSWNGVFANDGTPVVGTGVTIEGTAGNYTITIELSKAFNGFDADWADSEWIRFCFGVSWGATPADDDDFDARGPDAALGIQRAYLLK